MSPDPARFEKIRTACAQLQHGVRGRYVAGCRCMLCRAANSRYSCQAQRKHDAGETGHIASAEAARKHLLKLSHQGVGYKAVAKACDVAASVMLEVRNGRRRRIRQTTERRILAVDREAVADGALVSAGPTWRLLDELILGGYSKAQLARWLGYATPALQINRRQITAATASRVERMYRLVQEGRLSR